jgi:hypothetical protein
MTGVAIQAGKVYKFRYRAKNIFGWGTYSDQGDVQAASQPVKLDPPVVSLIGTNVKIAWTPKGDNGTSLTAFKIQIRTKVSTVFATTTHCDGASSTVFANNYCLIPMETFTTIPFVLVQGDLVAAVV